VSVSLRVLIVADSENAASRICSQLDWGKYRVFSKRVTQAEDLLTALGESWDVVICDYSIPSFARVDALRVLRSRGVEMPFIHLSGISVDAVLAKFHSRNQQYVPAGVRGEVFSGSSMQGRNARAKKELRSLGSVRKLRTKEMDRFAGGIAHDFNNLLGVITGWAELGYEQSADSGAREKFQAILAQTQKAAGLTEQLLGLAHSPTLEPRDIDLSRHPSNRPASTKPPREP